MTRVLVFVITPGVKSAGTWAARQGERPVLLSSVLDDRVTVILELNLSFKLSVPDELRPLAQRAAEIVLGQE